MIKVHQINFMPGIKTSINKIIFSYNDHVIIKFMKILYYENLELYDICTYMTVLYLCVPIIIVWLTGNSILQE